MKVNESNAWDNEFPERFPWGSVDSITGEKIAIMIVSWIESDKTTDDRVFIPGLRQSLRFMAEHVECAWN